ncbi:hypothetical protein MPH_04575 [Macrophomina phaseolina MS6]|uniref:Uncharacterized protein n=1 Tax=Macrophomina phaseolina (strain MS6) TaxID=1126212 RepID=K2R747_MACPH|nr:hypothetical protein MPH_04575 [Macrophomina phaseolina MS6]
MPDKIILSICPDHSTEFTDFLTSYACAEVLSLISILWHPNTAPKDFRAHVCKSWTQRNFLSIQTHSNTVSKARDPLHALPPRPSFLQYVLDVHSSISVSMELNQISSCGTSHS